MTKQLPTTAERVTVRRTELGMSRQELATAADVSYECIRLIENGDVEPRMATRRQIADALKIELDTLTAGVSA